MSQPTWQQFRRDLSDAYKPRPPITYILDGVFAQPSLNVVYGSPGCLKSMLCADLAVSIAGGTDWLEPARWDAGKLKPHGVLFGRAVWIDQDNGEGRTANRFEALARARNLPDDTPLVYYAMPSPPIDLSKTGLVVSLIDLVQDEKADIVFIDNLATISGLAKENTSEMTPVMSALRLLSERTGAAIVVIHHSTKGDGRGKLGDDMRGFGHIRAAVDIALRVDREPNSDIVTVTCVKSRDADIPAFSAHFTYQQKNGCKDLETAKFWGVTSAGSVTDAELEEAIIDIVKATPGLSQTKLTREVKAVLPKIGEVRIRSKIGNLTLTGAIRAQSGARGSWEYYP